MFDDGYVDSNLLGIGINELEVVMGPRETPLGHLKSVLATLERDLSEKGVGEPAKLALPHCLAKLTSTFLAMYFG